MRYAQMIAYLKVKLINKGKNYIILEAGDLGYQVFVNPIMYAELTIGDRLEIYTHHNVREDAETLYGFKNLEELEMFELLLSISGVGPKSALGVLSIAKVDDIKSSIARGDATMLTKVSGIGRKTAERIILDLRDKVASLGGSAFGGASGDDTSSNSDEIDALITLGYSVQQAREALRQVDSKIIKPGERIRGALKILSK
jgi:Holliday junction DNA helicase RuvA